LYRAPIPVSIAKLEIRGVREIRDSSIRPLAHADVAARLKELLRPVLN